MWHVSSNRMDFRFDAIKRPTACSRVNSCAFVVFINIIVIFIQLYRIAKMEINDTTSTVTGLCQLFGFAPYKIIRNKMNQIVDFKLSRAMCVYSTTIIIVFSISANYALLYDLNSGHSVRYFSQTVCAQTFCWCFMNKYNLIFFTSRKVFFSLSCYLSLCAFVCEKRVVSSTSH